MKKSKKVLLGAASIFLWFYMAFIIWVLLTVMVPILMTGIEPQGGPPQWLFGIFAANLIIVPLCIGLLIYYIADVLKNDMIEKNQKTKWIIILLIGNIIIYPIYWQRFIWKREELPSNT